VGSRAGLAAIEAVIDASGAAPAIEALLPAGVRHRQLRARTLLTGMMLALDDRRPAYLTEVRAALIALPEADQARLGVTEDWKTGPHQLTYRQTEHTCRLIVKSLGKDQPDGALSGDLQKVCDQLLEATIPPECAQLTRALAAGLDRRGDLVPAAPPRQHPMRRPRSSLGAPQLQPPRPQRRAVLRILPGAPRGAVQPNGGERPLSSGRRSGLSEAEGSLIRGTPGKAGAALTKPGRASTARWRGSGKQGRKVQRKRTSG
jgi:hypothetical protein